MIRVSLLLAFLALPLSAQSPLAEAEAALRAGQPWRTTEILAATLASPSTRTPDAVILAAQGAAGWEGWGTVRRLLERESWLDSRFDRLGRRLLAEAALGENRAKDALTQGMAAVAGNSNERTASEQGRRLLIVARALDRLDQRDSAAVYYRMAGQRFPELRDWFTLRAAGVEADSAVRAAGYQGITNRAAAARISWTEALARERSGDITGAIAAYTRLSARAPATRLRWGQAKSDAERGGIRDELLGLLGGSNSSATSREALVLIDQLSVPLTRDQRLDVARRAAAVGRASQAVAQYAAALKGGALGSSDRFRYGTALGDLNQWPDAAAQFRGVTDPALAGHAAYYAARAMLRSGTGNATAALQDVVKDFPDDTVAAGTALYLLGDLAIDNGDVDSARTLFRRVVMRYPTSVHRPRSAILAALITLEKGNAAQAARELTDMLTTNPPVGVNEDAIRYWRARALLASGDRTGGRAGLTELLDRGLESYYAGRAAIRLDSLPWVAPVAATVTVDSTLTATFRRAALLDTLGLNTESDFELDRVALLATASDQMLRAAEAFAAFGYARRSSQLASRALSAGAERDATLWRLIYPLPFEGRLRETAAAEGVDPLLAASVIRQESAFEPRATSAAGARGLMQMMPANAPALGRAFGFTNFDAALLWVPDVNLAFGMRHFAEALKRYPEPERALAAYNAGVSRVNRWSQATLRGKVDSESVRNAVPDIEVFIERIPYDETRGYVRAVMRNYMMYGVVYGQ